MPQKGQSQISFPKHKPISQNTNQWTGLLLSCLLSYFAEVLKEYLYCSLCGTKLGIAVPSFRLLLSSENVTEREAIEAYFNSGFSYNAFFCFLEKYHDTLMSLSRLKRRLSRYNLKRNKTEADLTDVERLIQNELDGPGSITGYRGMWHTLRVKYGLCIQREEVASLLRRLDPAGVAEQKRHKLKRKYTSPGPNYCWHVDGNDKRKPLGFPIHGAVDVAGYCGSTLTPLTMILRSWPLIF